MRVRYHGTPPSLDGGAVVRLRGYGTLVLNSLCDPLVGICTSIYISHSIKHYLVWPKGRRPPLQIRGPAVGLWMASVSTIFNYSGDRQRLKP